MTKTTKTITVNTKFDSRANGSGIVIAKAQGRQKTVSIDPAYSPDQNHAAAAGALLNVLCDSREQAKLRHPSGASRVRVKHTSDAGGKRQFTITL